MKEIFDSLSESERKQISLLSLGLVLVLAFLLIVSLGQRRRYLSATGDLKASEKDAVETEKTRLTSAEEWGRWEQAHRDIEELKKTYFFKEEQGVNEFRLDLQKILAESGITARSLRYNYVSLKKENLNKISVIFTFTGSYMILKRFLDAVERFPKFLLLEKIDFVKISGEGNLLELRIFLAGYYEST
jgi:Tfp pilus assembly protein PilO